MRILSFSLLFTFIFLSLSAQDKKALTLEDYKEWNRITNTAISPNGQWMTYMYKPNEGDTATFFIREIEGDTIYSAWNAKSVNFSNDSKWLAFLVDPMETEAKALEKAEKTSNQLLIPLHLISQTVDTVKDVQGYSFSEASNYIAFKKSKSDPDAKHAGTDLIIKDLNSGTISNIGNVSAYAFNEKGLLLAYLVDADGDTGNGMYIKDLNNHRNVAYTYWREYLQSTLLE